MSLPAWLHTLRSLRSPHVVNALPRGSGLLALNPRDLRRGDSAPLARLIAPALFGIPGLLRAARDASAVVGLVKPGALQGEGPTAAQFAGAVFRAAEEVGLSGPFFMSTAPLPVPEGADAGDHLRAEVQRYVDAGFTEIVLRVPARLPADAAETLRTGLAAVRERELSLTLQAEEAEHAAAALQTFGGAFDLVALGSPAGAGALDAAIELPGAQQRPGLQGVDLSSTQWAIATRVLGERVEPARARELESVDEATQLRLEALLYADALALLRADPFRGSAARVMRALAEHPGY